MYVPAFWGAFSQIWDGGVIADDDDDDDNNDNNDNDDSLSSTQGNYATQDSSSMCHLMARRHLPEWREEDERAFEHCGSSGLNHVITSESDTELSKVSFITL